MLMYKWTTLNMSAHFFGSVLTIQQLGVARDIAEPNENIHGLKGLFFHFFCSKRKIRGNQMTGKDNTFLFL